ncbi:hypothetical protein [Klebsiella quasipneumoniae]|uniref:hypothetical protein n=1 Tax=Klebsiella quasipneumoniae TaxID=1463165 RepID=UPI003D30F965
MTSKFSIDNRELLQRISSGEAVVGIDFGNLIVRELAAFRLAAMDQKPALHRYRRKAVEPYGPYPWHYEVFVDYPRPVECIEDEYFYAAPPVATGFAVDQEPAENHIGSKNSLDAIVSFIKSKSNPTVKCYEEVSEQLFKDNCHGIHSHVIEYILKLGEELEDLRAEQDEVQSAPEYPETLPCPVLLEPGLRFGKGIKTSTMLSALARRAVHESDMAALSPEEMAEFQTGIEYFKALIAHPVPVVPQDVLEALQKVARIRLNLNDFDGDRRGIADCLCDAEEALIEVVNRRAAMLHACNSPANPDCWCRTCRPVVLNDMRFVVCPDCGNKRCPRANDHRNACTGSNEPGQEGSAYPAAPQEVPDGK